MSHLAGKSMGIKKYILLMVLSIATLGGAELGKPFVQIGHTSWAMSVAVSRDGRFAVSGGSEGALILW
ncbi:hypothetical protein, partial [Sulfuricurvum sp.]|uniref:hypothetical protein n=1 Tax=Sulfuricurvum sp. TaxID=2025608 RepID=UPI0025D89AA0